MGFNEFVRENKPALCLMGIILGLPMTAISILSLLYSDGSTGMVQWSYDLVGTWAYWLILPGLFLLSVGSYYLYDFLKLLREFKKLIGMESKAKFIKNLDRIEELAWRLHPKYESAVVERKKKYKIR